MRNNFPLRDLEVIERDYNKLFERLVRVVLLVEKIKMRVLRKARSNFSTFTHFYHLLWCHKVNISFSFFSQSFVTFNSYLFILFFSHIVKTTRNDAIFKSRARSPELGERAANKWRTKQQKNIDGCFWAGVLLLTSIFDFIEYFRWRSTTCPQCRGSKKNSSPSVSSQLLNKYERICYVIITVPLYNP